MSKTTNKFPPEVREWAVRLVLDNEARRASRWLTRILRIGFSKFGQEPTTSSLIRFIAAREVCGANRTAKLAQLGNYAICRTGVANQKAITLPSHINVVSCLQVQFTHHGGMETNGQRITPFCNAH